MTDVLTRKAPSQQSVSTQSGLQCVQGTRVWYLALKMLRWPALLDEARRLLKIHHAQVLAPRTEPTVLLQVCSWRLLQHSVTFLPVVSVYGRTARQRTRRCIGRVRAWLRSRCSHAFGHPAGVEKQAT